MKIKDIEPKITLVGAGPGDIELITLKGVNALKSADVILYDALVNEELLELAPDAIKLFVGKRRGSKAYSQEEINQLIVEHAFLYGHVVRLKGGDPFVFGRGYEEILHAEAFNIPTYVVPGISSSISVPALAGIPVTHRGVSNSFFVLTGTLTDGSLNPEIEIAAQSSATVVILMGLGKLKEITEVYSKFGKSKEAVAIVSNGSLSNQISIVGTIDSIVEYAENIPTPGVIVVGPVVEVSNIWKDQAYLFDLLKF